MESIDEVNFGRANSSISHQLRYINTVRYNNNNNNNNRQWFIEQLGISAPDPQ